MSRTLSANVLAGIGGGSNPVYLLQVDSDTTTYYWATQPFTDTEPAPDQVYVSSRLLRKGLGKVKTKIDIRSGGNIAEVNQFEFSLVNGDLYSDTLAAQYFENRRVELRLIFADQDDPFWSNAAPLFSGFVQSVAWDTERIVFKCEDGWKRWGRAIPPILLSAERFPKLPEANEGRPAPIIIGDWTLGDGVNRNFVPSNYSPSSAQIIHRDYFKVLITKPPRNAGDQGSLNATAVVACHAMHTLPPANQDVYKFLYDAAAKRWYRTLYEYDAVDGFGTVESGLQTISLYPDSSAAAKIRRVYRIIPEWYANSGTVTDEENPINEDDTDYMTIDIGQWIQYAVPYTTEIAGTIKVLKLYWKRGILGSMVDDKLVWRCDKTGESFQTGDCPANDDLNSSDITSSWTDTCASGNIGGTLIKFTGTAVGADDGSSFSLFSVFLEVITEEEVALTELFDTGKGLPYGSWIDDEHTPDPALSEDDLIENAAYAVEALLIDLDFTDAGIENIDTDSFDAVATHRSSWKIARDILEQKDVFDYIAEICREFCFAFFERGDGTFTVRRIDQTAAAVTTYGRETFLMKGQDTSFKIGRVPVKEIYNDFILHYKVNVASDEAEKMLFVRSPEASYDSSYTNLSSEGQDYWDLCHDSYTNFQQVNKWEFTAKWIRDDATAELFLKWIIWRLTQRRHEVSFAAPLSALALELCDEAKFTHPLMPAAMDSTTRFRLTEQTIDPSTDTIDCTFTEVA